MVTHYKETRKDVRSYTKGVKVRFRNLSIK